MKKVCSILIFTITLFLLTLNFSFAQNFAEEEINQQSNPHHFQIELELGTQSVWNNSIPIIIHLKPQIDSDKVEIRGNTPTSLDFEFLGKQYFSVRKGESYRLQGRVVPKRAGTYKVSINAIAWQYDTNYSSSQAIDLTIDENLKIVPQSNQYKVYILLKNILTIILIVLLGVLAFLGGRIGFERFKKWLLPQD